MRKELILDRIRCERMGKADDCWLRYDRMDRQVRFKGCNLSHLPIYPFTSTFHQCPISLLNRPYTYMPYIQISIICYSLLRISHYLTPTFHHPIISFPPPTHCPTPYFFPLLFRSLSLATPFPTMLCTLQLSRPFFPIFPSRVQLTFYLSPATAHLPQMPIKYNFKLLLLI